MIFTGWVITVESFLLAMLNDGPTMAETFFIYLGPQLLLFGLAQYMRNTVPFLGGILTGILVTTTTVSLWELKWFSAANSMPFAIYLFITVPALALGIAVAELSVRYRLAITPISVGLAAFFASYQ